MDSYNQQLAPANDFDLGACLWGYGTTLDELPDWASGTPANLKTIRLGWDRMEREYDACCLELELDEAEFDLSYNISLADFD